MKETTETVPEYKEREISPDEAERMDALDRKYFKPETNIEYKLSFKRWKLVRKMVPQFDNKNLKEEKTVLELAVDSMNGSVAKGDGSQLDIIWEIISPKCRAAWDPHYRNGDIIKKLFSFKSKGEGIHRTYTVVVVGEKPAMPPPGRIDAFV
jgi:hypothetical protein